jgi:hypothetical protein
MKERPLRDWEIVTEVLSTWDQDEKNALLVKQYSYKPTLISSVCKNTILKKEANDN